MTGKFAHPRNPYRRPVDFKGLSDEFPEFAAVLVKGGGKVDFSDRESARTLAKCLLKRDFGLDVQFPPDSLSPSLTLKMNYLLWIEDILKANGRRAVGPEVVGVDIGTGGAALFPLMAHKHFAWKMIGTESNRADFQKARENVARNSSSFADPGSIRLIFNGDASEVLAAAFKEDDLKVTFTMSNPPFYDRDLDIVDSDAGRDHEVKIEGGEVAFVTKMAEESLALAGKVLIFTTMLGHRKNLAPLRRHLVEAAGAKSVTTTEFCQGRTMRWGLAWTFDASIDLAAARPSMFALDKSTRKLKEPFLLEVADKLFPDCPAALTFVREELKDRLGAKVAHLPEKSRQSCCAVTFELTEASWRGQRAKRRRKRNADGELIKDEESGTSEQELRNTRVGDGADLASDAGADGGEGVGELLLRARLQIARTGNDEDQGGDERGPFAFSFVCLDGKLGRAGLHELVQYFKNRLKGLSPLKGPPDQ